MEPVISQEAGTERRAVLNETSRHIHYLFPLRSILLSYSNISSI